MQETNLSIDRIVLKGFALRSDRAGLFGSLLEQELQRRLSQDRLPEGLVGKEISRLDVPPIQLAQAYDDEGLARSLAESIARGLLEKYR
ncbi:MAG: hypothetical protein NTY37_13030 [Methanothrix sp.]|nr:hypothetical protein [Methanothrix sp.]